MSRRHVTAEPVDPRARFSLYRLCECAACDGRGKVRVYGTREIGDEIETAFGAVERCPECRGEGRVRQELATAESPEAVGVALVTLAREGEFEGCQFGLLDRLPEGKETGTWLVLPWPETARTASAAGKLLRSRRP